MGAERSGPDQHATSEDALSTEAIREPPANHLLEESERKAS